MQTIIVGADGTDRSADALSFAHRLATATGARLLLVNVVLPPAPFDPELYAPYTAMLRDESEAMLRRMEFLVGPDVDVTSRIVMSGSPAQALHEVAHEEHAGLIVVGSSHVGRLGRVLPGSTGERLLHGAPCPIAIVPRGLAGRPWEELRVIGVGDDAGPEARVARDAAVALAHATGTSVRVFGVCDVIGFGTPALMYGPGYFTIRDDVRAHVREELDATVATLPADVHPEGAMLEGDPAERLAAASQDLDLLVLGSRGYGPMHAVLAGGVSGRVAREAACPVVIVPRGADVADLRPTVGAADTAA